MSNNIVGVRFRKAGKIYYFDPQELELNVNDQVIVETARGLELGEVAMEPHQASEEEISQPLKPVIRKAEERDIKRVEELENREKDALAECARLVEKLDLPMKLLSAEYNLDGSRLTLHFSAAERVDFRELVRELAGRLKVRVEMRQTGPRDEAKLIGGCGRCGRSLCCGTFLSEFAPVSMRMAKDQGLPLNPMKISGVCGRLMCCLVYENEQYHAMKGKLPKNGQMVVTPDGLPARVIGSNPLKETVTLELETKATLEVPLARMKVDGSGGIELVIEESSGEEIREKQEEQDRTEDQSGPEKQDNPGEKEKQDGSAKPANQNRRNRPGRRGRPNRQDRRKRQNGQENQESQDKPDKQQP